MSVTELYTRGIRLSKRKSIQHYRDRGIKAPVIAYLLDKSFVYLPVLAVALLAIVAVIASGVRDLNAMAAPPEDNSPYRETEPRDFLGKQFATDFVQQHPDEIDESDWVAENEPMQPRPVFSAEQCSELGTAPNSLLTTYRGEGEGLRVDALIFGAGQAKRYFDDTESIIENCDNVSGFNESTVTASHGDNDYELDYYQFSSGDNDHVVFTAGDAIFEIRSTDSAEVSAGDALDFYAGYAVESMNREQWQCVAIETSYEDYVRSFYHDFESYEGLFLTEPLEAETPVNNLPVPTLTKRGNTDAERSISTVNTPNLEAPEAPLPEDFSSIPENEPDRPQIPLEFETIDEFKDTAYYEIPDYDGPSCGWEWAAQISPVYDEMALEHNREVVRTEVQSDLEQQAGSYLDSSFYYTLRTLNTEPVITRWNEYVNTVNSIHDDWAWLEDEREALRPAWDTYLAEHAEWENFPNLQDAAREEYNADIEAYEEELDAFDDEVAAYEEELDEYDEEFAEYERERDQCLSDRARVDAWDDNFEDAVRNGDAIIEGEDQPEPETDEDGEEIETQPLPEVPERPEDCQSLPTAPTAPSEPVNTAVEPERPSILDEDRGSEPQPPTIPEGVTVPNSWEDPAND